MMGARHRCMAIEARSKLTTAVGTLVAIGAGSLALATSVPCLSGDEPMRLASLVDRSVDGRDLSASIFPQRFVEASPYRQSRDVPRQATR